MTTDTEPTPSQRHVNDDDDDDQTHAVCEVDARTTPILAICGIDCTNARDGNDLPYCQLCVTLLPYHLARCGPCMREFLLHDH